MARLFNDASSEYLEYSSAVLTAVPITMAAWFRSDDAVATQSLVSISRNATTEERFQLRANGSPAGDPVQALATANNNATVGTASTSTGYSVNTWHHAAGVFTSSTSRAAFIDGGSKGTNTTNVTPGTLNTTSLGAYAIPAGRSQYMSGRIAEAAIWNAALSDDEIAVLARGVSPLYVRPSALAAYWPLWGLHSPEINLTSANLSMTVSGPVYENHAPVTPFSSKAWGTNPFLDGAAPAGGQPMWKRVGHLVVPTGVRFGRGF